MAGRFSGQTALITGGGRGIGQEVALRLAAEGARLTIFDMNLEGAEETCARVKNAGGDARAWKVDVTSRDAVASAVKSAAAQFGGIDVLVNNAGIGWRIPFLDITDADWSKIIGTNLTSCFIVGQEVARVMVTKKHGRIVNVASINAHIGTDHQAAYAASKGGIVALTRVMAFELAPLGICVNAVSPGPIETALSAMNLTPVTRRAREERIPQGRLGKPGELAAAIAFLASPDASYINGTVLVVDGGLVSGGIREPKVPG
ncbi:MAG: glucose 1-dehydrogenase [Betaproteobacteria bacterium]|nr:glucose 1-dehydrogenase [Betaproteobacteria bacterium]